MTFPTPPVTISFVASLYTPLNKKQLYKVDFFVVYYNCKYPEENEIIYVPNLHMLLVCKTFHLEVYLMVAWKTYVFLK